MLHYLFFKKVSIVSTLKIVFVVLVISSITTGCGQKPVKPLEKATFVTIGVGHTCALTETGGVKCWGANLSGQVGDGSRTSKRLTPVQVVGLTDGVIAIDAGSESSCAVTTDGELICWGRRDYSSGFRDYKYNIYTPTQVIGLNSKIVTISTQNEFCVLTRSGGVKCWCNCIPMSGEIEPYTVTPEDVSGLENNVTKIAVQGTDCALTAGGKVKCWGSNQFGELGNGTNTNSYDTPVDVAGITQGAIAITTGENFACALMDSGNVKCWGHNSDGQLGDGTNTDSWTPVDVIGLEEKTTAISAGFAHVCALLSTGGVKCWGSNIYGQLGVGSYKDHSTPVSVKYLSKGVVSISAGYFQTCAVTANGEVMCWGKNDWGQLGDGSTKERLSPVYVVDFGGKRK